MLTMRSNLIVKDLLVQAVQAEFAGAKVLMGSAAVIVNNSLPENRDGGGRLIGGTQIVVPYFNSLGVMEWLPEGDALTPAQLTMQSETAVVQHGGKAVEITSWAQFAAAYADPYAEFARQFREMAERGFEDKILEVSSIGLPASNIHDVWSATAPVLLNWDVVVDAKMKWGDEQSDIVLITMHSKVYGDLLKLKDSTGRPLAADIKEGSIGSFCGMPVKVSDRNTIVDPGGGAKKKYRTRIFKKGAVVVWFNGTPQTKTDSDILMDSEIAAMHVYVVFHRYLRTPGSTKPGVIEIIHNSSVD